MYEVTSSLADWSHVPSGYPSLVPVSWGGGGFSVHGPFLGRDPPDRDRPYGKERAECILLECILVYLFNLKGNIEEERVVVVSGAKEIRVSAPQC